MAGDSSTHSGGQSVPAPFRSGGRGRGAGGGRRDSVPAGVRQAAPGAGCLVRSYCDEHASTTPTSLRGAPGRHLPDIRAIRLTTVCWLIGSDARAVLIRNHCVWRSSFCQLPFNSTLGPANLRRRLRRNDDGDSEVISTAFVPPLELSKTAGFTGA